MKLEVAELLNESNIKYNKFYMNRYIKFLEVFGNCNDEVVHKHHILPRSMFPEYINFKDNEWNCATLSPRAHFVAHYLLCKAFNTPEMYYAFRLMSNLKDGIFCNSKMYEVAKNKATEIAKESIWIYKNGKERKIKADKAEIYINKGWEFGRINKQTPPNHKGLIWVNKEGKNKKVSEKELDDYLNNGWVKGYPKGVHDKTDNRKLKARDQYNKNPKKWYCYYKLCTIRDEYNVGYKSLKTVLRIALQTDDFNINDFDVFNSKEVFAEALDEWLSAYEPSEEALTFERTVDSVISFLKENWDTNIDIRRLVRWFGIDAWKIADVLYDEYMETGRAYREGMYLNDMRKSFRAGWNPHHCPTYKFYKKFCLDM